MRSSYLYHRNTYTAKTAFFNWDSSRVYHFLRVVFIQCVDNMNTIIFKSVDVNNIMNEMNNAM